jgi:hypothetical protein
VTAQQTAAPRNRVGGGIGLLIVLCCLAGPAVIGAIGGSTVGGVLGIAVAVALTVAAAAVLQWRAVGGPGRLLKWTGRARAPGPASPARPAGANRHAFDLLGAYAGRRSNASAVAGAGLSPLALRSLWQPRPTASGGCAAARAGAEDLSQPDTYPAANRGGRAFVTLGTLFGAHQSKNDGPRGGQKQPIRSSLIGRGWVRTIRDHGGVHHGLGSAPSVAARSFSQIWDSRSSRRTASRCIASWKPSG